MDWGAYEGYTLIGLRQRLGTELAANEARGLDFRPPAGESPRDVVARIRQLLADWRHDMQDRVVITHKGVRRAMLVLATGWDMTGKPPFKVGDEEAMALSLDDAGKLAFERVVPLR